MSPQGYGAGSAAFQQDERTYLTQLLGYLCRARQKHQPALKLVKSPHSVTIHSFTSNPDAAGVAGTVHSVLVCDADIVDDRGQSERQTDPSICKATPWKSVDWCGWDGAACWYATGIRITRPPA